MYFTNITDCETNFCGHTRQLIMAIFILDFRHPDDHHVRAITI